MKCMEKHHINKQSSFHGQQPHTTKRQLKTKATGQGWKGYWQEPGLMAHLQGELYGFIHSNV